MLGKSKLGWFWLPITYKKSPLRTRTTFGHREDGP